MLVKVYKSMYKLIYLKVKKRGKKSAQRVNKKCTESEHNAFKNAPELHKNAQMCTKDV